jgi:ATP-dependent RNA helicase DeaD
MGGKCLLSVNSVYTHRPLQVSPPGTGNMIEGLKITKNIRKAMAADGIRGPTQVQIDAIGAVLAGKHVVMHTGTGTGKTLAYLLPLLQRLRESDGRVVVCAPGAELAMQTMRVVNAYKDDDLAAGAAIATSSHRRQRKRIQRSTRLIVGTPDRLSEMLRARKLKGVSAIVLDEIEPILASRGAEFLDELLSRSQAGVQLVVAAATLGKRSEAFIERFMADGIRIHHGDNPLQNTISHHIVPTPAMGKEVVLVRFIKKNRCKQAIVFVSDPRHQHYLLHFFGEHEISAVTLSRERSKEQRKRGLEDFRQGKVQLLLSTDKTARGIDIPNVQWVLHYDLPRSAADYVHRAGRTGRAGQKGVSVVFADNVARGYLRHLSRQLKVEFTPFHQR